MTASQFDITFSDLAYGGSTVASGWVTGDPISPGVFEAMAGSLTLNPGGALDAGTYALYLNPNPPNSSSSSSGFFTFDNQVNVNGDPFLDNDGLLFEFGSTDINLFSNGGSTPEFQIYENNGANKVGDGTITVAPAPEPSTVSIISLGAALALLHWKRRK